MIGKKTKNGLDTGVYVFTARRLITRLLLIDTTPAGLEGSREYKVILYSASSL